MRITVTIRQQHNAVPKKRSDRAEASRVKLAVKVTACEDDNLRNATYRVCIK